MFNRFLNSQTKTVTFAAFLLGFSSLISRALGLIRDRLLAGNFGAGEELDIYFAAFRIPDFVYGILITGGITAAFLPVFSEYFQKKEKEAFELTNNVLNCFLVLLILICGILVIFSPFVVNFIAPGFSEKQKLLTASLTRIMFLSPILFGLSSIFSGILQYFNRFLVYSLAPILYNLGIIFGILFLVPIFGLFGLAYGVILGALFHLLIQIPSARISGYRYYPIFNFNHPGLKQIFKLMIPRTIGSAVFHLNLIVITALASTLAAGSIAIFNFADNLQYFPIGIIGVSFALAVFPVLSRAWAAGKKEEFLENFSLTFRQILFLIIPVSILMFILRAQLVRLILGTGQFGWLETRLTAASLGFFCLGIFAASLTPFLARVFFSLRDTRTPVLIGIISLGLNIFLAVLFLSLLNGGGVEARPNIIQDFVINFLKLQGIKEIGVLAFPLAFSIATIFHFFLLLIFLHKKIGDLRLKEIWQSFKKILIASILMVLTAYFALYSINNFVDTRTFFGLFSQAVLAGLAGSLVYIFITFLLKSPELKIIFSLISKQFHKETL